MRDFMDRVPSNPNRKKIVHADSSEEFVTITFADNPTENGTNLNRNAFMAMQGMEPSTTEFNEDGSITETFQTGVLTTTFNEDGSITEVFVGGGGLSIAKTTSFNEDGSISESISN